MTPYILKLTGAEIFYWRYGIVFKIVEPFDIKKYKPIEFDINLFSENYTALYYYQEYQKYLQNEQKET